MLRDFGHRDRPGVTRNRASANFQAELVLQVGCYVIGILGHVSSRDVEGMRKQLADILERDGHFTSGTRTNPSIYHIGRYLLT